MRRHLLDISVLVVVATVACGYVALAQPADRDPALHAYVLIVGGLAMLGLVSTFAELFPRRRRSPFDQALVQARRTERAPDEVARMQREVTLAVSSAYDLHRRLLPHLREIARCRLERAGRVPGPETLGTWWELLRPDRPEPVDRFGPGISQAELRALVADLERM
ncbi:MAG: hypothetical protein ACJ76I_15030 [Gaiellaceae bacterium]